MNDIDDNYKQKSEDLELEFLESMKNGKSRKDALNDFLVKSRKCRDDFEKEYLKNLEIERKNLLGKKTVKDKKIEIKHFEIKHFDFKFGFFEKLKMRIHLLWFHFKRIFWRLWNSIIPNFIFYFFYKINRTIRRIFSSIWYSIDDVVFKFKDFLENFAIGFWKSMESGLANISTFTSVALEKIMFWNKKESDNKKD